LIHVEGFNATDSGGSEDLLKAQFLLKKSRLSQHDNRLVIKVLQRDL